LFRNMLDGVNKEVISFLFKGDLPHQEAPAIQEARTIQHDDNYTISKDEIPNSQNDNREAGQTQPQHVTETIVRDSPKINRNDTVSIQNVRNGQTQTMKFKKAEAMIASGEWVVVSE
jgi:preprotein translocase subunit SecA